MRLSSLLSFAVICRRAATTKLENNKELRETIQQHNFTLVAFYSTESENSEEFLEGWTVVREQISAAKSIDCTSRVSLCADLDVASFPAIRLYSQDGDMYRHRGPRKAVSILSFARRMQRPVVTKVSDDDVAAFTKSDDVVFLARIRGDNETGRSALKQFRDVAAEYHDRGSFGILMLSDETGNDMKSKIECHNHLEDFHGEASELSDVRAIRNLQKACMSPLIPRLSRRNELQYLTSGKSLVYYCSESTGNLEAFTREMRPLAKSYRDYLTFVTVDSLEYPETPRRLGIKPTEAGLSVQNPHTGHVYPYRGLTTPDAVNRFIVAISGGKVEAWDGEFEAHEGRRHDEL